jgi:glycosyltransferase involved in cell wall biosynthesis
VPYIFEDRLGKQDFIDALLKIYNMTDKERAKLGKMGRKHVEKNYNFENFNEKWVKTIDEVIEEHGSWETRKNYKPYTFLEIK